LYERRHAIVDGTVEPTSEEIEAGEKQSLKDNEEYTPLPKDSSTATAIPEFWLTALRNHLGISELITDRDAGALKHLTDIHLQYLPQDDPRIGFKILFDFSPNEYFDNTVLEKTYIYQAEVGYMGDFIYERAIGTEIKWKDDKDLTKEFEIKKQRNKSAFNVNSVADVLTVLEDTNRTRMVRKARPIESFFNFFSPPVPPSDQAIEDGEIDEEELEEIEAKLEMDYQIGEDLKEKVRDGTGVVRHPES
jgi:nucleosome assembly protein 1-like 1